MSKEIRTKPVSKEPRQVGRAARVPKELVRRGMGGVKDKLADGGKEDGAQAGTPEADATEKVQEGMNAAARKGGEAVSDAAGRVKDQLGRRTKEKGIEDGKRQVQRMARERKALRGQGAGKTIVDRAKDAAKAKTASKGTVKTAKKSVKSTQKSVKAAGRGVKTAQRTARTTAKTAKATGRAAQQATRAAKAAARAAATTAKAAAKAAVSAVKMAILALKGLVAAIAAGGWVVLLIAAAICLVALLVGSIFGIFFSGEDSGNGRTMPAVVSELTTEFYGQIEDIKRDNPHDVLIMDAMAINWREVLAMYAIKVNTDPDSGMEVASLDDAKVELLRGVLNDMVSLSHTVHTDTVTPDDGDDETEDEEVEIVILTISMAQKTADEMAAQYGFSQEQQAQLHELLSPDYADLWAALIGSGYMPGMGDGGEILPGDPGRAPLGIFSWPLAGDYPVNSPYGWRPDPFDPSKTDYHGGVDVACPEGTPILAAADGTVVVANATDPWGGSYGYHVKIQHDGTFSTLYAHCSSIAVMNGQQVQKGQVIGYVGSTGNSKGNHLHFEVYVDGARVNPMDFFE